MDELFSHFPELREMRTELESAADIIIASYKSGGKVLTCGNGGSAADSEHIVGELLKSFEVERPLSRSLMESIQQQCPDDADLFINNLQAPLRAVALTAHPSFATAFANDVNADLIFSQQLLGLADRGDVLIALSTSGNSRNVVLCVKLAKVLGVHSIGLTGRNGSALAALCDVCIGAPSDITYRTQEFHLAIYHALCRVVERHFF